MGKKHRNLMVQIADPENLRLAYARARKGKSLTMGHLLFKEHAQVNLDNMRTTLLAGTYQISPYKTFYVFEPKRREIQALPFPDRVIQHALCNIIGPIFEKVFMPVSYACRVGYGSHRSADEAQAMVRRLGRNGVVYCLKMDFKKYFASIDLAILHREIRRKISCSDTLDFIEVITPTEGTGLPIGNLTSQIFANLYGHIWDRWLVHTKAVPNMFRYMDDTLIFSNDRHYLKALIEEAKVFLAQAMKLQFSKWSIFNVTAGVPFLGFRIWPRYRLLRQDNVRRARRKIAHYRRTGNTEALAKFIPSWLGHASHASTHNLKIHLGLCAAP